MKNMIAYLDSKIAYGSLGCELTSHIDIEEINSIESIKHVQYTIPSKVEFKSLSKLRKDIEVIFHSTLFRGDQFLNERYFFRLLNHLNRNADRNIYLVEHLLTSNDKKLSFSRQTFEKNKEEIISNIQRIQRYENITFALENAPVTEDVSFYFDSLFELKEKLGLEITIDLPHLLISMAAIGEDFDWVREVLVKLSPKQIHLAGVLIKNNQISDNHKSLELSYLNFLKGIDCDYLTIECSAPISSLSKLTPVSHHKEEDFIRLQVQELSDIADELEQEALDYFFIDEKTSSNSLCEASGIFEDFDKLYPYISPIPRLAKCLHRKNLTEIVKSLGMIIKYTIESQAILGHEISNYRIEIIEKEAVLFSSGEREKSSILGNIKMSCDDLIVKASLY